MSFNKIYYNGIEINKVYLNGNLVWEAMPAYVTVLFMNGSNVHHIAYAYKENSYCLINSDLPSSDPTKDGYTFTGWYYNGNQLTSSTVFDPTLGTTFEVTAGWQENGSSGGDDVVVGQYTLGKKEGIEDISSSCGFFVITNSLNTVLTIAFDNGTVYEIPLSECQHDVSLGLPLCYVDLANENFIKEDSSFGWADLMGQLNDFNSLHCSIEIVNGVALLAYEDSNPQGLLEDDNADDYEGASCTEILPYPNGIFITDGAIGETVGPVATLPDDESRAIYATYFV